MITPDQIAAAQALIDEYNAVYAAGGELEYPHWADQILRASNEHPRQPNPHDDKIRPPRITATRARVAVLGAAVADDCAAVCDAPGHDSALG